MAVKIEGPLKIISLQAENIKKLVAVEIAPDGALVEITGRNGAGKTSILDAIWWAIEGAKHVQAAPIRKGANKARIKLDLGEVKVTRTFNRGKDDENAVTTSIIVENEAGARYPSPQKVLDDLFGVLTFDPMAFLREDPKKQLAMLRGLVPDVDFAAIDKANAEDFAKRTDANRNAKALRAQAAGIVVPAGLPDEPVDEAALVAELEQAGEQNALIEKRKANRATAEQTRDHLTANAAALVKRANELREQAAELEREADERLKEAQDLTVKLENADPLPDPVDTASVRERIANAAAINRGIEARERRRQIEGRAADFEDEAERLTAAITERKARVEAAIKAAKMPVAGLGFGDDGALLNGLPLEQASDAEQLRTAVAIAMAMNPTLRVIRVRDGSLLDDGSMKLLAEMAETRGYQVWVEMVNTTGRVGFVIEDGRVASTPASRREKAA